jgi:hypothetical protein
MSQFHHEEDGRARRLAERLKRVPREPDARPLGRRELRRILAEMEVDREEYRYQAELDAAARERTVGEWAAAGGSESDWEDLGLWSHAVQVAVVRTGHWASPDVRAAGADLMRDALAALAEGPSAVEELKRRWWPYGHSGWKPGR